ncbi:MAG TPA: S1 family peptidase [Thermoanaerobaculia bacterium]|nr:S1 family peptidase [Thermoanaerobaculia bacterium]
MRRISFGLLSTALLGFLAAAASAQQAGLALGGDLVPDAEAYARQFGVDLNEALRRLTLQPQIGELDAALAAEAPASYAGLWIEHVPEYRVMVRFTEPSLGRKLLARRKGAEVASLVHVLPARWSLAELQQALEATARDFRAEGVDTDLQIKVQNNRVEALTVDTRRAEQALFFAGKALSPAVALVAVTELVKPQMMIQGGRPITDFTTFTGCTSAFVVRSSGGELGITTAGHCDNNQTNEDDFTNFTYRTQIYSGSHDVQWHSAGCGVTFLNQFDSGTGIRNVTGSLGRGNQAVGAWVCKNGRTTGATCGSIGSKSYCPSYVPSGNSTFICVNPGNVPLSQPGDSGGPWFSGNTAYGVHSGGNGSGTLAIYMAIDYLSNLGLTVLNYDAGTNPPSATVTCSGGYAGSQNISCYATGYAGHPPYTYNSWSYYGSTRASSFSYNGSSANAQYSSGCAPNSYQSFSVTITDACGQVGYGQSWFLCQ